MKTAEIVSVGTELLMGQIADTNAQLLGQVLPELGIAHYHRQTVGDNLGRVVSAFELALSRADLVFTIGGLGPTEDDLTRHAIAHVMGEEMVLDEHLVEVLRKLFALRKLNWTERQNRQAMRPPSATALENRFGTAPGLWCPMGDKVIVALPGPRGEFWPMLRDQVRPRLEGMSDGTRLLSRTLKIAGIGESIIEQTLGELMHSENPTVAPYAKLGEVHLRLTARCSSLEEGDLLLNGMESRIRERLPVGVYGRDEVALHDAVVARLITRGETISTAESMTAGMVAARLTRVSGSSQAVKGGAIVYSAAMKSQLLGVRPETISQFTVVSEEVAREMALGARARLSTDWAIAVTGNAGPNPDAGGKPVGLVYLAVAGPDGVEVKEHHFRKEREENRELAVQMALLQLWHRLQG
jgi:nicotinamide-nucleotide amidase